MGEKETIEFKIDKIKKIKINSINKECLIKIINVWEYISENDILKNIENSVKKEINDYKLSIIEIRLDSILEEIKKKNYIEKTENKYYTSYIYDQNETLYIKELDNDIILKKIENMKYEEVKLYNDNILIKKKKKKSISIKDLEKINKIVNI